MLAYPLATLVMAKQAALFTYVLPFFVSTAGGTLIAAALIFALRKTHVMERFCMSALSITGAPLVHVMTNSLSQNDCANLLLAVGARPIMAEAEEGPRRLPGAAGRSCSTPGFPRRQSLPPCGSREKRPTRRAFPWF